MLFVVLVLCTVVAILLAFCHVEFADLFAFVLSGPTFFALLFVIVSHVGLSATARQYEERYNSLLYKINAEDLRDEYGIINKAYIDEVQAWNEEIAKKQALQNDFWIGIFISPIWDQFELIDLETIKIKS